MDLDKGNISSRQTFGETGNALRRCGWLLIVFTLITFFANRASLPTDIMESRNIVTAREIVADGNWLVPTMNGELRLEKPPLPTWVAGAVEELCPGSLAAQRTAAGVMGCLWTLYLFLLVRYVSKRDDLPIATVVVFLTCYNVVLMGRSATWDIYCHAFMMAAIYYLTLALYDTTSAPQKPSGTPKPSEIPKPPCGGCIGGTRTDARTVVYFVLAGLFMGLSFLSKGPVSFYALLLPYLITLIALPQPQMKGKWKSVALMVVVMLAVGGWWYVYLLVAHQQEVSAVVGKESGAWVNHNVRPWWYYWRFFAEMGAWALLMLAALAVPYWKRHITLKREYLLSVTWALASIVLLSLMPEKKTRYLLPSLAPCSIVVACLIVHFKQGEAMDNVSKWLYVVNGLLMTVVVLLVPVLAYHFGVREGLITMGTEIAVSISTLLIACWLVWHTLQYHPMKFIAGIAAIFAFAELFLLATIGHTFGNPDARSISAVRTDTRTASLPFYHNAAEPLRIELVYEAGRKILPLDFGDTRAVEKSLPCAIVTRKWAKDELPPALLECVDTTAVGTFDDNKHSKSDRHYTVDFINHVTILKLKK